MKILETYAIRGPNCWNKNQHSLIIMKVEIDELKTISTVNIQILVDSMKNELRMTFNKFIDLDFEEAVFSQRKGEIEISIGYLVARIAIALQRQVGVSCNYGTAKATEEPYVSQVVFSYMDEKVGLLASKASVKIVESLLKHNKYDVSKDVLKMQEKWDIEQLGQLSGSIIDEAIKRKIPCIHLNNRSLIQFGYGAYHKRIQSSVTNQTGSIGVKLAGNKEQTKRLLQSLGVPVPTGKLISVRSDLQSAIDSIGYPVVMKPSGGNQGRGVTLNITNFEAAISAFEAAKKISRGGRVIIEKYITGFDYRLLVINYKFVAAAKRTPAMITGNGISTISQLIDIVNSDPRRGEGHSKPLTVIKIDDVTCNILKNNGLTLNSILPINKILFLKFIANLSAGGTSMDVTDLVHPNNIFMAERITRIIGLDICGMDIITPDISVPFNLNGGSVVEVNSAPGFRLHIEPTEGKSRNVAASVIDMLFPEGSSSRIPIIAVTGSYGTTITCSLIEHLMAKCGYQVGCATAKGIYIHNVMIQQGDCTYCENAELVLKDPTVNLAVLECAVSGILKTGLGFQNCDIGIVVNIEANSDIPVGIKTINEVIKAASVVSSSILPTGYAILNADDERVYQMHIGLECHIAYFSLDEHNPYLIEHIERGGYAAIVENGYITICNGLDKTRIFDISDITDGVTGKDPFSTQSILSFILVGVIYKINVEVIRSLLETFKLW